MTNVIDCNAMHCLDGCFDSGGTMDSQQQTAAEAATAVTATAPAPTTMPGAERAVDST